MSYESILRPCLTQSFYGSVTTAGLLYLTGQFALIPVTAKFITNMTICVTSKYTESAWASTKRQLLSSRIAEPSIQEFAENIIKFDVDGMNSNKRAVLRPLLSTSFELLRGNVEGLASDRIQSIIENSLAQSREMALTSQELYIFTSQLRSKQDKLVRDVLGKEFASEASSYVPIVARNIDRALSVADVGQMVHEQISRRPQPIYRPVTAGPKLVGRRAAHAIVQFLCDARLKWKWISYTTVTKYVPVHYSYSNHVLKSLDGKVLSIDDRYRTHRVYINTNLGREAFIETALRALRGRY